MRRDFKQAQREIAAFDHALHAIYADDVAAHLNTQASGADCPDRCLPCRIFRRLATEAREEED